MIAFGSSITKPEVYESCAATGFRRAMEPDSAVYAFPSVGSIYRSYNALLDQAAETADLEALVLVHQDTEIVDPEFCAKVRRVLICTGKVYYDLSAAREAKKIDDVAIVRIEQLYPLTDAMLGEAVKPFAGAELVWVQEEPFNMGAWYHVNARWPAALGKLRCISRPESASPATGSEKSHKYEQQLLVDQAFA